MGRFDSVRDVVTVLRENFATFLAGSLAYSAFMSIVPLFTLAVIAAGALGSQSLVDQILLLVDQYLPSTAGDIFQQVLESQEGQASASVISLALLLWSGLRVFRSLDVSFSLFYGTEEEAGFLHDLRDALLVVALLAVALVAAVALGAIVSLTTWLPFGGLLGSLLLVVLLLVAFLPIYYVFPDVDVTVGEVLPGAVVAAVGWALLQALFQMYVQQSAQAEVYGVIGGVLLVLTWLYLAGLLLLVGVAVNVVLSGRTPNALSGNTRRTRSSLSD